MFKAIILLKRRDDMTSAEFEQWWFHEHAPLAAALEGVRKIVFNKAEDGGAFDGVSELWFDSREAFEAAYATDHGKAVAADSIAHLADRQRLFVTEKEIVG